MRARGLAGMLTALTLTAALASCAPSATPTPTPSETGFASEAEAFAAAEETYRAYVDALNDVDLSDPATFEPVYALTTGDALDNEKASLTQMHADGWTVSGRTTLPAIYEGQEPGDLLVCQDVSAVDVQDAEGNSQVAADRPDVFALEVRVEFGGRSESRGRVAGSRAVEDPRC